MDLCEEPDPVGTRVQNNVGDTGLHPFQHADQADPAGPAAFPSTHCSSPGKSPGQKWSSVPLQHAPSHLHGGQLVLMDLEGRWLWEHPPPPVKA